MKNMLFAVILSAVTLRIVAATTATQPWVLNRIADATNALPSQSGLDTNAVRGIVGAFAASGTVHRASSVGNADTWTDATGCVWRVEDEWLYSAFIYKKVSPNRWEFTNGPFTSYLLYDSNTWTVHTDLGYDDEFQADEDATSLGFANWGTLTRRFATNLVGRVALTNDVPSTPGDIGAAPASVADTVQAWQTYWDGDDVRVTVTNYYGSEDLPHLYIEQKMPADETHDAAWFKTIWDETTRHQPILQRIAAAESAIAEKADRAWGFYDSHTGEYSPDGYTQISSSNILIAAGMAYQKTITTDGEVWVLTATEPTTISGVTSNGFFRISDGDGNALFEIVKGDKRTVGATASGITVTNMEVTILYNVVAETHPTVECCTDLMAADWQTADATWTGTSGAYVAHIEKPSRPHTFFRATYQKGAETYIKNSAPVGFERVYIGGRSYRVTVETVGGKKLMVLNDD